MTKLDALVAGMLLLAGTVAFAADPVDLRAYQTRCANCHGQNAWGDEEKRVPAIAGLPAAYVIRQIEAYRGDLREEARMHREAVTIGEDLAGAAAVIAGMTPLRPVRQGPADSANGKVIVRELCAECHGSRCQGLPERGSPPLTGFQSWYVVDQILRFKEFARAGDSRSLDSSRMHSIAYKVISVEDVEDVAAYLVEEAGKGAK